MGEETDDACAVVVNFFDRVVVQREVLEVLVVRQFSQFQHVEQLVAMQTQTRQVHELVDVAGQLLDEVETEVKELDVFSRVADHHLADAGLEVGHHPLRVVAQSVVGEVYAGGLGVDLEFALLLGLLLLLYRGVHAHIVGVDQRVDHFFRMVFVCRTLLVVAARLFI